MIYISVRTSKIDTSSDYCPTDEEICIILIYCTDLHFSIRSNECITRLCTREMEEKVEKYSFWWSVQTDHLPTKASGICMAEIAHLSSIVPYLSFLQISAAFVWSQEALCRWLVASDGHKPPALQLRKHCIKKNNIQKNSIELN